MRLFVTFVPVAILLALLSGPAEHRSHFPLVMMSAAAEEYPPLTWINEHEATRNVALQRAEDCTGGCWRLIELVVKDEIEGAGLRHWFVKAFAMEQLPDVPINLYWPDGSASGVTKTPPEWGDIPLQDCYPPENGAGVYSGYLGNNPQASDHLHGMGLPACHHYSYWTKWLWVPRQ